MGITPKELIQPPMFEGLAKYVYCRQGNGDWSPTYTFEFFGGQVSVEVEEAEVLTPPVAGTMFWISGHVRRSVRNGTITLAATEKKFVAKDESSLTLEQLEQYVKGLPIHGVAIVEDKQSATVNRMTYLSATLRWQGATHQFKKLTPEIYQRIPGKGPVRFEMAMLVREERNTDGQLVVLQVPSLVSVQMETMTTGAVPSAGTPSAVPAGTATGASKVSNVASSTSAPAKV